MKSAAYGSARMSNIEADYTKIGTHLGKPEGEAASNKEPQSKSHLNENTHADGCSQSIS